MTTIKTIIDSNFDLFIIPNNIVRLDDMCLFGRSRAMNEFAKLNNISMSKSEPLVEVWVTGELTENLGDHGFNIRLSAIDDRPIHIGGFHNYMLMPVKMFSGKKEGDSMNIILPFNIYSNNPDFSDGELHANIKLSQTKYRYKRFGNFEDTLDHLMCKFK